MLALSKHACATGTDGTKACTDVVVRSRSFTPDAALVNHLVVPNSHVSLAIGRHSTHVYDSLAIHDSHVPAIDCEASPVAMLFDAHRDHIHCGIDRRHRA